ncbi:MAG: GtrA family protein [Erysipelotrichaceae bacterium]|nr:GtrA family protein [Erysipelotrichaceae bacterium]
MIKQVLGFISTSLSSTGIELLLYTVLNYLLEDVLPFAHIVISSIVSRCISETVKFTLDKKAVFKSKDSSFTNYVIFAVIRGLLSTALISIIYYFIKDYRTIIKMGVDFCLFFPSFIIQKKWIHKQ